ncbi:MAG: MFS transporter [Paracoccaceae bacterium]
MTTDGPARTRWGLVLLLFAAGLLAAMQFAKLSLTLGEMALLHPGRPVAFLVSAVALAGLTLGVLGGSVVARIGPRRVILGSVALGGALSLTQAGVDGWSVLLALRLAEGVAHLGLVVALPTLMAASAAPRDRSVVMGLWGTFFGVGFVVYALVLDGLGGARAGFAAHGAALLALWPVLWALVPRIEARAPRGQGAWVAHRRLYSTARLSAPGLGHGIYTSLFIALVAFLPGALGLPWLTGALPVANLLGTFAAGFVARSVAAGRLATWAFAASALSFAALWALAGTALAAPIALLTFLVTGALAGANFAAIPELNRDPADQALANGGMAQMGNVGTFTGTPLFAAAFAVLALDGLMLTAVAICGVGALAAGFAYRRAGAATG